MTLRWIPLEALQAHPENANRMPDRLLEKLRAHLARTGRYEPLVVRPLACRAEGGPCPAAAAPRPQRGARTRDRKIAGPYEGRREPGTRESSADDGAPDLAVGARGAPRYQILNGHHRARALRDLGHTHARCDVWEVDDDEARLLLATLNRLEGKDDPSRRGALVARLSQGRSAEDLARLLPEPPDALARLKTLAEPPPEPADPPAPGELPTPMTFFLDGDQRAVVDEALRTAAETPVRGHELAGTHQRQSTPGARRAGSPAAREPSSDNDNREREFAARTAGGKGARRAEALARLARRYLEARGRR